jgi:putative DNA methylase
MTTYRKKLIEVALPLDEINAACKREKSIRHGHPSTLHLWWARRPLAAARSVIFAQMVDDPSSIPGLSEEEILVERERLFEIIRKLVLWENTTNEEVLEEARAEIRKSWARTCAETGEDPNKLPAFHDPFAGGGALPLEAQRLGLESYASDLNPVAVLINKAMIEIPPKFAGKAPVNPKTNSELKLLAKPWRGAEGLAEDVRYYGEWMRDEAQKKIGHLYPKIEVTRAMVAKRPDLAQYQGQKLTVIAWLWARTVKSPNPAFSHVDVPLASTFMLSTKKGKEHYVQPVIEGDSYRFEVKAGVPDDLEAAKAGTKVGRGIFGCLLSGARMTGDHIKADGCAGRMGARLMAIVAEGKRSRVYLSPTEAMESVARSAEPNWRPEGDVPPRLTGGTCVPYGMTTWGDLFTPRQLVALTTFSDLVGEARERAEFDAIQAGLPDDGIPLRDGGKGAKAYAEAVGVYLTMGQSRLTDIQNSLCRWELSKTQVRNLFGRQAIPMMWDFGENNVFNNAAGDFKTSLSNLIKVVMTLPGGEDSYGLFGDAQTQSISATKVISTDPPYYDNIGYADLSDFFYVWLRRGLRTTFPNLFATVAVPKAEELVATPYRHGGKQAAETFFLDGMTQAMNRLALQANPHFPVTIYYAFKQSEIKAGNSSSTGWETFLAAVIEAGFGLTGTWPMRTELANRMIGSGTNALASSIVLVCRKRPEDAPIATRRDFLRDLRSALPVALANLQRSNLAPVDLAQSSIGPGMAVFSKYRKVIEADGSAMTVRSALQLINQVLDESLGAEEGQLDGDTRFAVTWFESYQYKQGPFGEADNLARARAVSVAGVEEAGVLKSAAGQVRLFTRPELPADWDPAEDKRLTVWEATQYLIKRLEEEGEQAAAALLKDLGATVAEQARNLAYRLYTICERKKWAEEARAYNGLVLAWPELEKLAASDASIATTPSQVSLEL